MNNANKQFKMILMRDLNYIDTLLKKGYEEFEKEMIDEFTPTFYKANKNKSQWSITKYHEMINIRKEKWKKLYYEAHKEDFEKAKKLREIITLYYDNPEAPIFEDYNLLDVYFKRFKPTYIEKGEILAYFTNFTILHYKNYRYLGHEEEVREAVELEVKENHKKLSKKEKQKKIEEFINNFDDNQEQIFNQIKVLRNIIAESGELIPEANASEIPMLFRVLTENISEDFANALITSSIEKARKIKNEQEEQERKNVKLVEERNKTQIAFENNLERQKEITTRQRNAKKLLKQFLNHNVPICYIGENLDNVINLLKEVGYSENQINDIKRAILINDKKILEVENQKTFKINKEKYLEASEISLLNLIETILTNPDAIRNPIFNDIQKMYQIVKEKLLLFDEISDEERDYEIEYMGLCITELNELLASYRASSYKLILEKNSNKNN